MADTWGNTDESCQLETLVGRSTRKCLISMDGALEATNRSEAQPDAVESARGGPSPASVASPGAAAQPSPGSAASSGAAPAAKVVRQFREILLWPLQLAPIREGAQIQEHWE